MSHLQKMIEEETCAEAVFMEYIELRNGTTKVFVFFEGKDDCNYYYSKIAGYIGEQEYHDFICNGKKNVLEVYDLIKRGTLLDPEEKKLFFVDRDFDVDMDYGEDIYVTPTYSIENFYISNSAIKKMIFGLWGLSGKLDEDDKNDYEEAKNFLIQKRDEVINSMIYANAWYSLQKRKKREDGRFPVLKNIKKYDQIQNVNQKELLEEKVEDYIEVEEHEIIDEIQRLREKPEDYLRGKYFEQTMPDYFMDLFRECSKKKNRTFKKRHKVNLQVNADNMVIVLNPYADVPQSLVEYLSRKLSA